MALSKERLVELVNLALDGQATEEEHRELKAALAESAEARDLDAATRDLIARLDSVHPADVPEPLRPAVMEQVRRDSNVVPGPGVRRRRRFAVAWAAAAALVLVFL